MVGELRRILPEVRSNFIYLRRLAAKKILLVRVDETCTAAIVDEYKYLQEGASFIYARYNIGDNIYWNSST